MSKVLSQAGVEKQYLLSDKNIVYHQIVERLKTFITSEPLQQAGPGGKTINVPMYGVLSIFGRSMPIFAYDNPTLIAKTTNTAFTDGQNIFLCVDFMRQILEAPAGGFKGLVFLTLHEFCHPFFNHGNRLKAYPHAFANHMQDMSINTKLLRDFVLNPNAGRASLSPLPEALRIGVGFKEGQVEKYAHRSEEEIALEHWKELQQQNDEMQDFLESLLGALNEHGKPGDVPPSQSGNNKSNPSSDPGMSSDGLQGEANEPNGGGEGGEHAAGENATPSGMGTDHMISPDKLAAILKESGLGHVVEKLNMPVKADGTIDSAALEKQAVASEVRIRNALSAMTNIEQVMGNRTPGSHMLNAAKEMIGHLDKPIISWKTTFKSMLVGNGSRRTRSFDHPGDAFYFDPSMRGTRARLYLGANVSAKPNGYFLTILDTSGSMEATKDLKTAASEIFGLVQSAGKMAPDVLLYQIDTAIRGEPTLITPRNVDALLKKGFEAVGRGGTSLQDGMIMALESNEVAKRKKAGQKLLGLLYFTDLGCTPPAKSAMPDNLPKNVIFFATPGTYEEEFAASVRDYAKVISMGEKMTVEFSPSSSKISEGHSSRMRM